MLQHSTSLVTGFRRKIILCRIRIRIFRLALAEFRSVKKTARVFRDIIRFKKQYAGEERFKKLVKSCGKYYWQMHLPGFPSKAFDNHVLGLINRFAPIRSFHNQLTILYLGITKKCPLSCKHCYAWAELNEEGELPVGEMKQIISTFQDRGLSQVCFLGGEPIMRFDDLLEMVRSIKPHTESWISTSGYKIDREKSDALKKAGLTGVAISLDHFDPLKHNDFRGSSHAYEWAVTATQNCTKSGLLTCWSICVTRDILSRENLIAYAELAASYQVNFIQLFEPMVAGRFSGMDVRIDNKGIRILEEFYLKMNTDTNYSHLPIVVYPSYHQRRMGCLAFGNRYLYIDPDGCLHPCPFCRSSKKLRIFSQDLGQLIEQAKDETCLFGKIHRLEEG